jgi:hypothetical protein
MNEKQKPITEQYRNNYDKIFDKPNLLAEKLIKQIEENIRSHEYITPED